MTLSPTRLMEISKNIQEARLKQRKTTEDMAECIGISASYYCQIEAGSKSPSLETLINIADALHVSVETLIYGEPSSSQSNILHMICKLNEEEVEKLEEIIRVIIDTAF